MNKYFKISLFVILGAIAGYAYYFFVGCTSGSCPLTSNWLIMTVYGAVFGLIIGLPEKKKNSA